jgi:integration host factor subunit beta
MLRSELISTLADKFPDLLKADVETSVATILDGIANQVSRNGRVEIRGFGSFQMNHRPERNARNPRTGERLVTPATVCPHFKAGKALREGVDC